ncbi:nucleotide exchange factor GrpE [Desulfoscipio gibsoniae]|uniref:Protein GrpE n=1 Tax=Desulfoscipio gibsoniae DSM 7213 TaxID=767817 RepID=R4KE18_9FIRM|nr:nucleotide exchange factor GrpE [Desulfoscipio gibsoniae]AGL00834.1 molecular chaperone GrpE (heat shock protein) [Desulfoscipio gibsoniae DSM 7213]
MDKLHRTAADSEEGRNVDAANAVPGEHLPNEDLKRADHQAGNDVGGVTGTRTAQEGGATGHSPGEPVDEFADQPVDLEQLQRELADQKTKAEEYLNRLVRLQADFDNYRKRTVKEKEEFFKYAAASLCEALLPVLDNFQLALAAKDQNPAQVAEGVDMIFRQLQDVLQKEGLTPVAAVGEQFDPTRHEAVMQEVTDEYAENTVTAELRRGYYLKDKLLRPAMVKVAKPEG